MSNEEFKLSYVLNLLSELNEELSYDKICETSQEQKKEYHNKLNTFIMYNEMDEDDFNAPIYLKQKKGESLEALASCLVEISGNLFIVERNFTSISSELEITRGQLSSLNSLSVLIKNLSEKKDEKAEKKQNRVETIEDPESGLTVKNEYKQDKLVMSQMYRGSKKVYDVFYGNKGEIISTKNYNESGKVSLEMTYHSNGQVKERKEYVSGRAEISKFDANGNKIK